MGGAGTESNGDCVGVFGGQMRERETERVCERARVCMTAAASSQLECQT